MLLHHLCDQYLTLAAHRKSRKEVITVTILLALHRAHNIGDKFRCLRFVMIHFAFPDRLGRQQRRIHLALTDQTDKQFRDNRIKLRSAAAFKFLDDLLLL